MTKLFFTLLGVIVSILIVFAACSKNTGIQPRIVGLWEERIACGFRYPCTEHEPGNGNRVEFMANGRVNFYENGQISSSKNYQVVKSGDCKMPDEFWFLKYSDNQSVDEAFTMNKDTLRISGVVCGADGPIITYVKIR